MYKLLWYVEQCLQFRYKIKHAAYYINPLLPPVETRHPYLVKLLREGHAVSEVSTVHSHGRYIRVRFQRPTLHESLDHFVHLLVLLARYSDDPSA